MLELSAIRRNRGISLEDISKSTKISKRSLEAIENCDFARLPGGIYNTSYIRQYARAIDYDESQILEVYYRMTKSAEPSSPQSADRGAFPEFRPASGIVGS